MSAPETPASDADDEEKGTPNKEPRPKRAGRARIKPWLRPYNRRLTAFDEFVKRQREAGVPGPLPDPMGWRRSGPKGKGVMGTRHSSHTRQWR